MLTIDGSFGEGGGQILRSSLSLSMVTGRPFRIERIRAGRKKPGLMRQHLTAVQAATEVAQADVRGAHIGSACVEFHPGDVRSGTCAFAVGTAEWLGAIGSWFIFLGSILVASLLYYALLFLPLGIAYMDEGKKLGGVHERQGILVWQGLHLAAHLLFAVAMILEDL